MSFHRTFIFHDNIYYVSEILANFLNKYTDPPIITLCINKNIINGVTKILNPKDWDFQRFVDAVTSQNIDLTELTLTNNVQIYQQIFPNDRTELVKFMKFILGLSYLLIEPTENLRVEDV